MRLRPGDNRLPSVGRFVNLLPFAIRLKQVEGRGHRGRVQACFDGRDCTPNSDVDPFGLQFADQRGGGHRTLGDHNTVVGPEFTGVG